MYYLLRTSPDNALNGVALMKDKSSWLYLYNTRQLQHLYGHESFSIMWALRAKVCDRDGTIPVDTIKIVSDDAIAHFAKLRHSLNFIGWN